MADLKPKGSIIFLSAAELRQLADDMDTAYDTGIRSFHWGPFKVKYNDGDEAHYLVVQPVD